MVGLLPWELCVLILNKVGCVWHSKLHLLTKPQATCLTVLIPCAGHTEPQAVIFYKQLLGSHQR